MEMQINVSAPPIQVECLVAFRFMASNVRKQILDLAVFYKSPTSWGQFTFDVDTMLQGRVSVNKVSSPAAYFESVKFGYAGDQ